MAHGEFGVRCHTLSCRVVLRTLRKLAYICIVVILNGIIVRYDEEVIDCLRKN